MNPYEQYLAVFDEAAPLVENPFTKNNFGILMAKGDQDFLNFVNMWMEEVQMNGTMAELEAKYIK